MARDHARLRLAIWGDEDFRSLTGECQRLYFLALSQPGLTLSGVVPFTVKRWATLSADATERSIRKGLATLQDRRYVLVDENTEEMWLRSFVKNDGVLSSPNIAIGCAKSFRTTHSPMLRAAFLFELHRVNAGQQETGWEKGWPNLVHLLTEPLPEGFTEGFPKGFAEGFGESRAGAAPVPSPSPFLSPIPDDPAVDPAVWAALARERLQNPREASA